MKGWSVVYRGERIKAEIIVAALQADGLDAEVFGDNAYGVGIDLTEARIVVPDDQAEMARKLIQEAESQPSSEDV
ncbi:MAG TPA: DUF2007 domain-containing protein [Candidatus Dormibacteraeota bacterium]|nr:DUF2007 domain-containing protein [Candidatus Dormibacteraeota bacterium]